MVTTTRIRSLAELRKIKEAASAQSKTRVRGKTRVVVRLGECRAAADARSIAQVLTEEVQKRELDDVVVETENCSRLCCGEPFVEIIQNGAPRVTYRHVRPSNAFRIIDEHIVNGKLIKDLIVPTEEPR
ncbi:MAG: (2Fe-2S) ferredoxin domain-containing protein [Synergistaceae bacterium]|jgi:NADP-reducing hydrogenase subunit HndB|nr:(2Fe-2S) ferredoxin domain-containing protein [Synergistaceae bacterium]